MSARVGRANATCHEHEDHVEPEARHRPRAPGPGPPARPTDSISVTATQPQKMLVSILGKALVLSICIEAVLALVVPDASTSRACHCHKFRRREIVASLASLLTTTLPIQQSLAADGFDDTRSPFSGLSQQIRRSAVRGAQVIDKIDGKWERFSDDFGLGGEMSTSIAMSVDICILC